MQTSQVVFDVGGGGAEWLRSFVSELGSTAGIDRDPEVAAESDPEAEDGDFGITIERYVFAILAPAFDGVLGADDVSVESSWFEDRTKGTRLRVMPAPKTRWSSSGRK